MVTGRHETRERIVQAASELAWESGPGKLSLDAVAAKAGVSKGGLLYHFPSKAKLLEATVETFVEDYDRLLKEREAAHAQATTPVAQAFLDVFIDDVRCKRPPSSGILAALAEDPSFLNPIKRYDRALLDRIKADLGDTGLAMILYFVISGLKCNELLSLNVVRQDEIDSLTERLRALISE
ncbi:TetR/AcrR family transcriptional regulator [Tianweitania sp. BSSL-BM11]|uniref:TetR/AcrR family transcriptional regulator n=1 Tax=Tianweitania aestuarii TaxID=2814886 RepID=A0ABS5RPY3_9HYPH|nr:TetR/AcrR family transcriptional regulator [Tianweitania aestuarii]MBS9719095.1 TetR/AcrR family transcriptional regulator [Tianweitania aestuarii]